MAQSLPSRRALIVDDEFLIAFDLESSMRELGFDVCTVASNERWLTPPSRAVFFISVLLAVLALLVRYAHVAIPVVSNHSFETLLIAFLLLLAGNLFKGF